MLSYLSVFNFLFPAGEMLDRVLMQFWARPDPTQAVRVQDLAAGMLRPLRDSKVALFQLSLSPRLLLSCPPENRRETEARQTVRPG